MSLRSMWSRSALMAMEASYGTSPTDTLHKYEGGSYLTLPATAVNLTPTIAKNMPETMAGRREKLAYAPVPGNRKVQGDITGLLFPDALGMLLDLTFGTVVSTQTADAGNPLGTSADLSTGSITVTNPTTSAFLQFVITSAAGTNPSLTVAGVDANGDTVSETISVTLSGGAATVYTRHSYDTLSGGTVTATNFTSGSCTVNGFTKVDHVYSLNDDPASATICDLGDPGRGSGEAGFFAGCMAEKLSIDFDASTEQSPATFSLSVVGQYGTMSTAPTSDPSVARPFAGWSVGVTRGGSAEYHVARMALEITTGNSVLWVADDDQDPRYSVSGGFVVSGNMLLLPEGATQWDLYEDNTESDFHVTFTSQHDLLYTGQPKTLLLEMSRTYFTNAQAQDYNGVQALQMDFSTIYDSSDGAIKPTLTNAVYSY